MLGYLAFWIVIVLAMLLSWKGLVRVSKNDPRVGRELEAMLYDLLISLRLSGRVPHGLSFSGEYKFFTALALDSLRSHQRFGADISPVLQVLRDQLQRDLGLELTRRSVLRSSYAQFIGIGVCCVALMLVAQWAVGVDLGLSDWAKVLTIQLFGVLVFIWGEKRMRRVILGEFTVLIPPIYNLRARVMLPIPLGKSIESSGVLDTVIKSTGSIADLHQQLLRVVQRARNGPQGLEQDLDLIVEESWRRYERELARFQAKLKGLSFLVAAGFFFTSYLLGMALFMSRVLPGL